MPSHSLDYPNRQIWYHLLLDGYLDGNKGVFQCAEERAKQGWIRARESSGFNFSYDWNDCRLNDDAYYVSSFNYLRRKESRPIKPGSEVASSNCVALDDISGEERSINTYIFSRGTGLAPLYVSLVALGYLLLILILVILFG